MLTSRFTERGLTLVELAIGLTITSILIAAGVPNFMEWMQNAQVRTATEGLQNGLQLARAEAVRRNATVRFQLTDTLTDACAISTVGKSWVVSLNSAAGKCGASPKEPPLPPAAPDANNPYVIRAGATTEGALNAVVASREVTATGAAAETQVFNGTLIFNAWGRASPATLAVGNNLQIDITNPTVGQCLAHSPPKDLEKVRCLRLLVSSTGQIQMCDPYLSVTDSKAPGACPWP